MAVNPAGYVSPYDHGNPQIITGMAFEFISGGAPVFFSGAADAVSSGINSFATSDLGVANASGLKFNGVAIQDAASGSAIGVAMAGCVIVTAGEATVCGESVVVEGAASFKNATTAGHVCGRALTTSTSGNYALIYLNP